jgi:Protein of unknown function (DUF3309)
MLLFILAMALVIVMVGSLPAWPHARTWGYFPSGGLGLILLVLAILVLLHKL